MGTLSVGPNGGTFSESGDNDWTASIFSATRSVVFCGDRIILVFQVGVQPIAGKTDKLVYRLVALDLHSGKITQQREFAAYAATVFATDDDHVVLAAGRLRRMTPDLQTVLVADHKGNVENISPDGSTLGEASYPGYRLVDSHTLKMRAITDDRASDTSVNDQGFLSDVTSWLNRYPKKTAFSTYTDAKGDRLVYHGSCGGRPQFLTNTTFLEPGCSQALIVDLDGKVVHSLPVQEPFSFAGVSRSGNRFALQVFASGSSERFAIYSVRTFRLVATVQPEERAEEQSWTALSPDGSMIVVGSPKRLTLYRLPASPVGDGSQGNGRRYASPVKRLMWSLW